jgi:outer membrane protein assembly factor BamB
MRQSRTKAKYLTLAGWLGSLALALGLLLAACADTSTATPAPAAPTSTPAPAATTSGVTPTAATSPGPNPTPATTPGPTTTPGGATAGATITGTVTSSTTTGSETVAPTPTPFTVPLDNNGIPVISVLQGNTKPFAQGWRTGLDTTGAVQVAGEADGMVFVKTLDGGLYALDAKSGAVAWKVPAPPLAGATPLFPPLAVVGPGVVALGDLAAEKITGYDTKTGQKKWDFDLRFNAPGRDTGSRFIGGKIYNNTLAVAVSSKQNPFDQQHQTTNPEYLSLTGIDLSSGKAVWSALTDPPTVNGFGVRLGGVIFGSKNLYVESPDLSVGAIEGATGNRLWLILNALVLHNDNPDVLYTVVPEAGSEHQPILRKTDPQTGKVLWEKQLPVTVIDDPLMAVSPDEKTVYVEVVSSTDTFLYGIDLTKNEGLWNFKTTTFKDYDLTATNEGVRLRTYGSQAGFAMFPRDKPIPAMWILGPEQFGDVISAPEGLYLTATDPHVPGALYLINPSQGYILYTAKTEAISGVPLPGETQVYLAATDSAGKPYIYAFARPKT